MAKAKYAPNSRRVLRTVRPEGVSRDGNGVGYLQDSVRLRPFAGPWRLNSSINASRLDITMPGSYFGGMRTTINLPESALELAKRKSAEEDASLGEVIAEAIYAAYLPRPGTLGSEPERARVELPVSRLGGGLRPGVRLESNAELEDAMNGLP